MNHHLSFSLHITFFFPPLLFLLARSRRTWFLFMFPIYKRRVLRSVMLASYDYFGGIVWMYFINCCVLERWDTFGASYVQWREQRCQTHGSCPKGLTLSLGVRQIQAPFWNILSQKIWNRACYYFKHPPRPRLLLGKFGKYWQKILLSFSSFMKWNGR